MLYNQNFFPFLESQCRINEQSVPSARKNEQRGMSVSSVHLSSDKVKGIRTRRVADQTPPEASRNLREEAIPKSITRVLDASRIRSEWKRSSGKRKQRDEEWDAETDSRRKSRKKSKTMGSDAGAVTEDAKLPPMKIQPGESLAHFNKLSIRRSSKPIP